MTNKEQVFHPDYHFLLFIFLTHICQAQVLFYQALMADCTADGLDDWIIQKPYQELDNYCNEDNYFGGAGRFGKDTIITKYFELPPHYNIQIKFKLETFGVIQPPSFLQIFIEDQKFKICLDNTQKYCQNSPTLQPVQFQQIVYPYSYRNKNLLISISSNLIADGLFTYWALKEIQLFVSKCPQNCPSCANSLEDCSQQRLAYNFFSQTDFNNFKTDGWQISDGKIEYGSCLGIPLLCGYNKCFQGTALSINLRLPYHQQIRISMRLLVFVTPPHTSTFQVKIDSNSISSIGYQNTFDNINYYKPNYCYYNEGQANYFEFIIFTVFKNHANQDAKILLIQPNLGQFSYGIRDFQIFIKSDLPIYFDNCGDGIVQQNEQCDDGNQMPFDGCYNCLYSCSIMCLNCVKGECLFCLEEELFNNVTFTCQYPIQQKECPLNCQSCNQGVCLSCQIPYLLVNQECVVQCGDGYLAVGIEECDDGNNIQFDGCYECKLECSGQCQDCKNGQCLDQCQLGYDYKNGICFPTCGDLIVISDSEDCDDGNEIQYDGCFQCRYSCSQNCNSCFEGDCLECDKGYPLNEIDNQCESLCGDYELAIFQEQCDDGNQQSLDGCSQSCLIELNYICKEFQECQFFIQPQFNLELQNLEENTQVQSITLQFDQQIFTKITPQEFQESINITFVDLNVDEYQITIVPIQEIQNKLSDPIYQIQIEIFKTINIKPHAVVQLDYNVYNKFSQSLLNNKQIIQIDKFDYLNNQQAKASNLLLEIQKKVINSESTIVSVLFMIGSQFAFWSFLGVLQDQSYIKYINCHYPTNLLIFFQYSNLASFNYYLSLINVNKFSNIQTMRQIQPQYKLKYYNYNPYLYTNLLSVLLSFVMLFFSWLIVYCLNTKLKQVEPQLIDKLSMGQLKFYKSFIKLLQNQQEYLKQKGKVAVWQANIWDLFFMSFSYMRYGTFKEADLALAYIITITFLLVIIIQLIFDFDFQNKNQTQQSLKICCNIKKLCQAFIIIYFQQSCIIQIMTYSFFSVLYLAIFFHKNQAEIYSLDNIREIQNQISILIVVSTSFFYEENLWNSNINRINLGWFHTCCLMSVAVSYLITDLIILLKQALSYILTYSSKEISINHNVMTFNK